TDVQQLAKMTIIVFVRRIVAESRDKLLWAPTLYCFGRGQFMPINIDDRSVRSAEFVDVLQSAKINLFSNIEALAVAFCDADKFFEPGRACGLDVESGAKTRQRFAHRAVNGKFIAAGMDAKLQRRG